MSRRYITLQRGWPATVDVSAPQPARHLARMVGQALRNGLPAARRLGRARSFAARTGIPVAPTGWLLRRRRASARPDLDALLDGVAGRWDELAAASPRLPRAVPALSLLALQRSTGMLVFVFGEAELPLLVLKPDGDAARRELDALGVAAAAGIAPRPLGRIDNAFVQECLPGAPLHVEPVKAAGAGAVVAPAGLTSAFSGLAVLAEVSSGEGASPELAARVQAGLPMLDDHARKLAEAAWRDVRGIDRAVLWHDDTSPQNCVVDADQRLLGFVDWETAKPMGAPGFDVLNATRAYLDCALGLVSWRERQLWHTYLAAWDSPLYAAARTAAEAAGLPAKHLDAMELIFLVAGIGERLQSPGRHATSPVFEAALATLRAG